jgi:hypothetical protein
VDPDVEDPDDGDVHTFNVEMAPVHGNAWVQDNQLFYEPETDFVGTDAFTFRATDPLGLSVVGTAQVTVGSPEPDFRALSLVCADQDPAAAQLILTSSALTTIELVTIVLQGVQCSGSTLLDQQVVTLHPGENTIEFVFDLTGWDETTVLLAGIDNGNLIAETNELNNEVSRAIRVGQTPLAGIRQVWTQNVATCENGFGLWSGRAAYANAGDAECIIPLGGSLLNYEIRRREDSQLLVQGQIQTNDVGAWHLRQDLPFPADGLVLTWSIGDGLLTQTGELAFDLVACGQQQLPNPEPPYSGPDGSGPLVTIEDAQASSRWTVIPGMPVPTLESGTLGGVTGTGSSDQLVAGSPTLLASGSGSTFDVALTDLDSAEPLPFVGQPMAFQVVIRATDSVYAVPVQWEIAAPGRGMRLLHPPTWYYLNGDLIGWVTFTPLSAGSHIVRASLAPGFEDLEATNDLIEMTFEVLDNHLPVADPASFTLDEDNLLSGQLSGFDEDGDPLEFELQNAPQHGTFQWLNVQTGFFSYLADPDFHGIDGFHFRVLDGASESEPAWVDLTINPINDAPLASDSEFTMEGDTTLAGIVVGSDSDSDILTFALLTQPTLGEISLDAASGEFSYTPQPGQSGTDAFQFQVDDGALVSSPGTVTIHISGGNTPPIAHSQAFSLDEDTSLVGTLTGEDPDGDALTFVLTQPPASGQIELDEATGQFTFVLDPEFHGTDAFEFRVHDGRLASNPARVDLTVFPINDPPQAQGMSVGTPEDTPYQGFLAASDPDGDPLMFYISQEPQHGTVTFTDATTGGVTYLPEPDFHGADYFAFRVSDGTVSSDEAVVEVVIEPANDPPVLDSLSVPSSTWRGRPTPFSVVAHDVDGDSLTYQWEFGDGQQAYQATVSNTYQAAGLYTVRITVRDGQGREASATRTIWVYRAQPGDADGNGRINLNDLGLVLFHIYFGIPLPGNGDCDENGRVDWADFFCVIDVILGGT